MTKTDRLLAAIADARRGHRITEYEDVALRLAEAAEDYLIEGPADPDESDVDAMAYWAHRIIENDGALSAGSSMDLDMAHDELTKAARSYLGIKPTPEVPAATFRKAVIADMQREVTEWCERKGWKGEGSAPVTFGDTMALLHSEISEALEAYRDWGLKDATATGCVRCVQSGVGACDDAPHTFKPEGVGSEFADVLIRLLDDCDRWGVDLAFEFDRKMAYNETRAFQHGGRIL